MIHAENELLKFHNYIFDSKYWI